MSNFEQVISKSFKLQVSEGGVSGYAINNKFGYNNDVDTGSTPEDVWSVGGTYTGWISSAENFEILSSSANDTNGGTGARTVTISQLLNSSFEQQSEQTVTLNGTTAVTIPGGNYLRCTMAFCVDVGSGGVNEGTITIRGATSGNTIAEIPAGKGQTQMAIYTVPLGKTLYVDFIDIQMSRANGSAGSAFISMCVRGQGDSWRAILTSQITDSQPYVSADEILQFHEETEIKIVVDSVSDNNTSVTGRWSGFLKDD